MKQYFFHIFMILSCSLFYGGECERTERLSSKVILQNKNGYFVLSDGSLWKTVRFVKRWRTPLEWWNNTQLAPKNYDCIPNDWLLGSEIEVYSKYDGLNVCESNASNQEVLRQCTHLFVNMRTNQALFAMALEPEDCIIRLFHDAKKEGYDEGYHDGCLNSYQDHKDIYDRGYADGYEDGYRDRLNEE